ncbi:DUF2793 domain-containing protein [Mesorhizobium sp. YIM 152430]|uniref:DUF2793 domain-containing protein n=1 Tax=Mesorhizobium sp. YIM 152430 TaxID=3031761 RepID=UPI0023D9F86C|nr:DUF2793 domain-containing protein [Mesorhizobium sp. YIM 152430]MDF1598907.1 DUF2793 domain-containing protein [Mesorhizobium sp. YIM 152430]
MQSTHLELPYILPSQAQKHVTHNEALRRLDACVQLSLASRSLDAPPAQSVEGERFLVADGAAGSWAGQAGRIAVRQDGGWSFLTPRQGWLAFVEDEDRFIARAAAGWIALSDALDGPLGQLGINASADAVNRLALKSAGSLFDHDGAGHRLVLNKASAPDTASILFQEAYSGRAEIGLAGAGGFALKTSADGEQWTEAMRVEGSSGRVTFPKGAGGIAMPIMGNSGSSVSAGQTRFLTPGLNGSGQPAVYVPVPVAGRFRALTCVTGGSPGIGESWTFTLQKLFSDTALTTTIPAGSNQGVDAINEVQFNAQERWCLKMVASPGAANSGNVLFSLLFIPD